MSEKNWEYYNGRAGCLCADLIGLTKEVTEKNKKLQKTWELIEELPAEHKAKAIRFLSSKFGIPLENNGWVV